MMEIPEDVVGDPRWELVTYLMGVALEFRDAGLFHFSDEVMDEARAIADSIPKPEGGSVSNE